MKVNLISQEEHQCLTFTFITQKSSDPLPLPPISVKMWILLQTIMRLNLIYILYKDLGRTSQRTRYGSIRKENW